MESRNLCIIEDEKDVADSIKSFMESNGYNVFAYHCAEDFCAKRPNKFVGVYLIDWNLPGKSGLEVIKDIRAEDRISPVFILSANDERDDIVEGLRTGADDYITKPFNFPELAARVDNAAAKYQVILEHSDMDNLKLLPEARAFIKDGQTVNLTAREYVIFDHLLRNAGEPVTRDEILKECFQSDEKMTNRNVDVHVFSLRRKLYVVEMRIETVWGKGYKLI